MKQIDANTIFLVMVFILPGYFALKVFKFLYQRNSDGKEIEITYQSLLCSAVIYLIYYTGLKSYGSDPAKYAVDKPWWAISVVVGLGLVLGLIIYLLNKPPIVTNFIEYLSGRFEFLCKVRAKIETLFITEPPNIYAAVFDSKYQPSEEKGYWLLWWQEGIIREGWVELVENLDTDMLLFIKDIKEIDEENKVVHEYAPEYCMIVSVNSIEGFEITT